MTTLPTNTILYFLTQQGCSHCALARPTVEEYRQAQLGSIFVYELDANRHPQIDGWSPKATPAFALKINGILMATSEGSMTLAQIEKFVQRGAAGKEAADADRPARRSRRPKKDRGEASDPGGDPPEGGKRRHPTGADDA